MVIVTDTGSLVQHVRYNDSGSPWGIPAGDVNGDGVVDANDTGIILGAIGGPHVARYDLNLDGVVDAADLTIANNNLGDTLGHNALSLNPSSDARGGHRLGYTGHTHADFNHALVVMRNRWYSSDLGRFMSRDPLGFVDGQNVYGYARGNGVSARDPMGLCGQAICALMIGGVQTNPASAPQSPGTSSPHCKEYKVPVLYHDLPCYGAQPPGQFGVPTSQCREEWCQKIGLPFIGKLCSKEPECVGRAFRRARQCCTHYAPSNCDTCAPDMTGCKAQALFVLKNCNNNPQSCTDWNIECGLHLASCGADIVILLVMCPMCIASAGEAGCLSCATSSMSIAGACIDWVQCENDKLAHGCGKYIL